MALLQVSLLTHRSGNQLMLRQEITEQEAIARTDQIVTEARATLIALDTFLNSASVDRSTCHDT